MKHAQQQRITARSVLIGSALIPVSCFWITRSEMTTGVTEITSTSLLIGAVFILFVLVVANMGLERHAPQAAFTGAEMLTIYVMLTIGMSINGIGMFGFLTTALANPFWYATQENGWADFHQHIPSWLRPEGDLAIRRFYEGESTLYTAEHLTAWRNPIVAWSAFTFVLLWVMFCINVIVRRRWSEQEQLSYPIAVLPLEMSVRERRFTDYFRNPFLWAGIVIASVIPSWNSVQFFVPSLPYIPVKPFDIGYLFRERPWNGIGGLPAAFHPSVIGLTFFIPLDVAFSCWFFYLVRKLQGVLVVALGSGTQAPWSGLGSIAEQGTGAWMGIGVISLWLGRRHLALVGRSVLNADATDDSDEPLSYRWAVIGLAVGGALLTLFCVLAGIQIGLAVLFLGLFFLYMLALTRIRGEGGVVWHFGPYWNPITLLVRGVGSAHIEPRSLTALTYMQWFNLEFRCANMPHQLEGFHIARTSRLPLRPFGIVVLLAVVLGIVASFWNVLDMYYRKGAGTPNVNMWRTNMGLIPYRTLRAWIDYRGDADLRGLRSVALGFVAVAGLSLGRLRFATWPFHPLGFAVGNTFIIDLVWMPMAISWALKLGFLRYGGIRAYRTVLPFFVGLLLGEYVTACLWSVAGVVLDIPMYRVFPN
ncbi:hypothetical protein HN371_06300 [Candidatus Poribacteria bacterium]|jgi:hypothetical protein|nr:hypothetical protein [Candidatus Poribacteria bacterium]MBT5534054.1 hypothetical protein [Candidatus Poribacteria bacterium]MBT5710233.1 hypothetical protein [Candidatus Poribacteria bacterium]MBT7807633.1 hypothetical protein [Candidatus Poribacteria bacterium]